MTCSASMRLLGLAATASALQQHAEVSFGHEEGVHQVTMQRESGQNEAEASWDIKSWFGFGKASTAKASVAKDTLTRNSTINNSIMDTNATLASGGKANATKANVTKASAAKHSVTHNHTINSSDTLASKSSAVCGYWCSDHIFVRKMSNKTVMKNVSSWAEKCTWSHCGGCSHCDGLSAVPKAPRDDEEDSGTEWKGPASCETWCEDGKFRTMGPNITMMMDVAWDAKCTWQHCGACGKCKGIADGDVNLIMEVGGLGDSAPMTEEGYQQVAALKSDEAMKAFIRRVIAEEGGDILDEGALNGIAPFYSGTQSVQDLEALRTELRSSPWTWTSHGETEVKSRGDMVPTTETGYQQVAELKSDDDMKAFIRRVIKQETSPEAFIRSEGDLNGMVPFHSGTKGVQNLEALRNELRTAHWILKGEARTAPLTEIGYKQVAKTRSTGDMVEFSKRLLDAADRECSDDSALVEMAVKQTFDGGADFEDLKLHLRCAPWSVSRKDGEAAICP